MLVEVKRFGQSRHDRWQGYHKMGLLLAFPSKGQFSPCRRIGGGAATKRIPKKEEEKGKGEEQKEEEEEEEEEEAIGFAPFHGMSKCRKRRTSEKTPHISSSSRLADG